ncbi:hypothetical protein OA179_02555 [Candidatus Pelagibacter sp.]|nr:hypothetical protein [Candidatus Pelagibacter sp.]
MKKYLLILSTFFGLIVAPTISNAFTVGISLSDNSLDTAGKEDVDSNGTIDATKNVTDDFKIGSIFIENTAVAANGRFGVTLGLDLIPFDADIDKRSISQEASGAAAGGKSPQSSGTNSVEGTVEKHMTLYVQPGVMVGGSMVYVTGGIVRADINGRSTSISHTDINETKDLDGTKIGVGIKRELDNGFVVKLDYAETSYDTVTFTTSNNTKATADLDNTAIALSIGRSF